MRFSPRRLSPARLVAVSLVAAAASAVLLVSPAAAHGFSSTAYVDVSSPADDTVRTALDLEYDLLIVSAADFDDDRALFDEGMNLFETGDEATALNNHTDTVLKYVTDRITVASHGDECEPTQVGDFSVHQRDGVPYAQLVLDYACPTSNQHPDHVITSGVFPDAETYVKDTKTIVTYEIDAQSGSAALDAAHPSFSTEQSWNERFGEFFLLGAEHLLGGIDHILFLLALIVGSRRLRDVVLAATTFTVAHSVTFLLAALGLVSLPAAFVEPIIALSIAVVAAWYLWGVWRRRPQSALVTPSLARGPLGLDRADWTRLGVVFLFGLVHGLGFAGALGIDEAFSWTLLWSLLVFNVGIEVVQLSIIAVVFPILLLLRRRAPRVGLWVGIAIAAFVTIAGLVWFIQRILGIG